MVGAFRGVLLAQQASRIDRHGAAGGAPGGKRAQQRHEAEYSGENQRFARRGEGHQVRQETAGEDAGDYSDSGSGDQEQEGALESSTRDVQWLSAEGHTNAKLLH